MPGNEVCLYHLTRASNLDSIEQHGLLTRRSASQKLGRSFKEKHSSLDDDPDAIYLGKRDEMNYPFALEDNELAMLKICIPEDDAYANFYPDEDYIRDQYGESEIPFEEEHAEEWEFSISEGYGAKYKGNIPAKNIVDCELGRIENDRFEKTGTCKW